MLYLKLVLLAPLLREDYRLEEQPWPAMEAIAIYAGPGPNLTKTTSFADSLVEWADPRRQDL